MLYWILDSARGWLDANGLYTLVGVLDQVEFRALTAAFLLQPVLLAYVRSQTADPWTVTYAQIAAVLAAAACTYLCFTRHQKKAA